MSIRLVMLGLLLWLLAAACGSDVQSGQGSVPPATTAPTAAAPAPTTTTAPIAEDDYGLIEDEDPYAEGDGARDPENVGESPSNRVPAPAPGEETPMVGEVPEAIMDAIFAHAAASGAAREDLVVVRAEAVTWSDGSLGCPEPGVYYTQALVPGYWVVLDHNGEIHDYRVDDHGSFRVCDGSGPPGTAPSG